MTLPSLWWGLTLLTFPCILTEEATCTKSDVITGLPRDANITAGHIVKDVLDQQKCADECCRSEHCDFAIIHEKHCVLAPCIQCNSTAAFNKQVNTTYIIIGNTKEEAAKVEECEPQCGAHSKCDKKGDKMSCSCIEGYSLKETVCTAAAVCSNTSCPTASVCSVKEDKVLCTCNTGLTMVKEKCEKMTCQNVSCPEHSHCQISEGKPHCFCDTDYKAEGEFCRPEVKCTIEPENVGCPNNETCQQTGSKLHCVCTPGRVRAKGGTCTDAADVITLHTTNTTVTLPKDSVSLAVKVLPAKPKATYYTYTWKLESGPKGNANMDGLTKPQVKISKLEVGKYLFRLTVIGHNNELATTIVVLEVKAAPTVNQPPKSIIKPSGTLSFKLPAEFSLNGLDSIDDDKITAYKWTLEGQPTASTGKVTMTGESTDTVHVRVEEGFGNFTFKLEVTDGGELKANSKKTVEVLAEDDFPPSAKVSAAQVITLPASKVTLYGNDSTDDHGIVKFEWKKSDDSPKLGDMAGTSQAVLNLTNLVEGTYTFTLVVFDRKQQSSEAKTTVTVRPAETGPPVAKAGDNKELVEPDVNTVLDGSGSTSPVGPLKAFNWQKVSGPEPIVMSDEDKSKLQVSGLIVGLYKFKLTVTDKNNVNVSDEVTVTVKADDNKPPVAHAGSDYTIFLPNTAVDIDGSGSTDDTGIIKWQWTRSLSSPALGQVINSSDKTPILKLCDLVKGMYQFTLTVYDDKNLFSSDSVFVNVSANPHATDIVEVFLFDTPDSFTQQRLDSLSNILMVPLGTDAVSKMGTWSLQTLSVKNIDGRIVVYFYGMFNNGTIMAGPPLVRKLRKAVYGRILNYNFDIIDTSTCSNECSGHGICDISTRLCVCDQYWMENFFKSQTGRQFSNCEWSKIYFAIITIFIISIFIIMLYLVWVIIRAKVTREKKKKKYKLLEEETGYGVNNNSSSEDSEFFRMKSMKSVRGGISNGNGFVKQGKHN